jgi:hypothetical protein
MSRNDTITRVYREAVASYGTSGVNRAEAVESATATLMAEYNAGRFVVDVERAIRAELRRADEADGRSADQIIQRAAYGAVPLTNADLDVVVTLGGGLRKAWADVTADDMAQMNELRFQNFRKVAASYEDFNRAYLRIREVVFQHRTFGAAFEAGGFPPADLASEAGVA